MRSRSALVAGVGILVLAVLSGVANVVVIEGLVTTGDATRTARDIVASAGLFRLGIAALVVVVVLDIVVAWALLAFFEPVDRDLARLAAWFRVGYAAIFAVGISRLVGVMPLLGPGQNDTSFNLDQRRGQALADIQGFHDVWHVSLVLFGLHLVLIGYLAYISGYVPRAIAVLLVVAGVGYLVDSFGAVLVSDYSLNVAAFTFIGEVLLMVWLLVKGRQLSPSD
jgi:hypothetical protein